MNKTIENSEKTRVLLQKHYQAYPKLQAEDIFKYIFQSAFGCEHMVSDEGAALDYIRREYAMCDKTEAPRKEELDGEYSRIHLSYLNGGLTEETLTKLFCLSAQKETAGGIALAQKLHVASELVADGILPLDSVDYSMKLNQWQALGYPAVHHSDAFRLAYHPAYRVIANRYAEFLEIFSAIDQLLCKGPAIIALEGGSASGKTTLADILQQVYDCNVFHMDDFFLRPEQRTPQRLAEGGGNLDRERFAEEILPSLRQGETVRYRRFDCSTQTLGDIVTVAPKKLTLVEGVYATHPAFSKYYDLAIFLDIDAAYQRQRILKRNSPWLAERFFSEWIPLENTYFRETGIKDRCDLVLPILPRI